LKDTDDSTHACNRFFAYEFQFDSKNTQHHVVNAIRFDSLNAFPLKNAQLLAQLEDFQIFFKVRTKTEPDQCQ
jgi:hypothetical protein